VVAPIAIDMDHAAKPQLLNTNADTAAGELAAALGAELLVFLTNVDGVLDDAKRLLPRLTVGDAQSLMASGVAAGGMIPKIEAAVRASAAGAATRIINGTSAGALATAIAGEEGGTTIV
jgi:acetylglutamate kinase